MKTLKKAFLAIVVFAAISSPLSAGPIAVDVCIERGWICFAK